MVPLLPDDRGVPFDGRRRALPLYSCVLAKEEGLDPPGEVLRVTHPRAEGHDFLEERRRRHRQEIDANNVCHLI